MRMMRPAICLLLLSTCFSSALVAGKGKKIKIQGHLVDIACAQEQKDDLDYMRKEHSKGCFQMPACVQSGFAVLTAQDQVIRFDAAGNALARALIEKSQKDKDWRIRVEGRQEGDTLAVTRLVLDK
jgi:hypothetical protein